MAIMEGPLSKWTNVMKGWQYRWFVLDENAGLLSYYTSKEKMMRGARRGCVRLKGAVIGIDDEDDSTFTITVDQKTFHFQARDPEEKEKWIDALEGTITRHSQPAQVWDNKPMPTMQDFDKKLSETDAYLQILIDQVQALETKLVQCESEEGKDKINTVKSSAENMIESIKQSIVLLQITKHLIQEKHATYDPQDIIKVDIQNVKSSGVNGPAFDNISTDDNASLDVPASHANETGASPSHTIPHSRSSECLQNHVDKVSLVSLPSNLEVCGAANHSSMPNLSSSSAAVVTDAANHVGSSMSVLSPGGTTSAVSSSGAMSPGSSASAPPVIPDLSYSSSEDEDFFDAEEGTSSDKKEEEPKSPPVVVASEGDYFDELYDDDALEDLGDLNQHGSMITHLLSQVRIGMDLTKVVLPTFILERRSLLEMYADFFAHPDLFVEIADKTTPYDRFVQTVRWYLSAFHAGRKYQVAKKPYNPILGETFLCHYDLPNTTPTKEFNDKGPVPWSTKSNLAFIAEQVSHHPPISAFYAENPSKKISLDGYIWTKSKFLGLSIGVHMIGQSVISVLDHNEEYTITFPNGYGRSILTVPWMELGGKCNISCPKTGYHATVDFHTKPFYGGKKDLITAELYAPTEKKSFCTVKGEWNGVMWAKYTSGQNECFVDTKKMPIIKKRVLPIDQQGEYESRRLWRDVTYNLKYNNVEEATNHKHKLEQRQREEAKARKEKNEKWETKRFHEVGEHWVYDDPLINRITAAN